MDGILTRSGGVLFGTIAGFHSSRQEVMIMAIIGYYLRQIVERDLFVLPQGGGGCSCFNTSQVLLTEMSRLL